LKRHESRYHNETKYDSHKDNHIIIPSNKNIAEPIEKLTAPTAKTVEQNANNQYSVLHDKSSDISQEEDQLNSTLLSMNEKEESSTDNSGPAAKKRNASCEEIIKQTTHLQELDVSEEEDQTNGTLQSIDENEEVSTNDSESSKNGNKSVEEILNQTTQLIDSSIGDLSINTKEKKKTAVVSPLRPEDSNGKPALQCESCDFIGKTTPGLKRHKSTAHRLSLKNRKKRKTINIQNETGFESKIEDIPITVNAEESDMEDSQECESNSQDSSFHSYSTALPADYLKYIYL